MSPKRFHFLDMGNRIYGDCIICELGETRILIDGGHQYDDKSHDGFASIPEQMAAIFNEDGPFHFDLLVVTHAHSDHIGCLPEMVAAGTITADWALVADEDLGFGKFKGQDAADSLGSDALAPRVAGLARALLEETRAHLPDAALAQFISDAADVEPRYRKMILALKNADGKKTKVVRLGETSSANLKLLKQLEAKFKGAGMSILGPTQEHLEVCAKALAASTRRISRRVRDSLSTDAAQEPMSLYREIAFTADDDGIGASDMPGKGAALNDMSVVLLFDIDDDRVLLAGDMQFAMAEVGGLDDDMAALVDKVAGFAPFRLYKVTHHAANNALNSDVLDSLGSTRHLVMCGGVDPTHPAKKVLKLFAENASSLIWARNDRCGLITYDLEKTSKPFKLQRGKLNDLTNPGDAEAGRQTPSFITTPASSTATPAMTSLSPKIEMISGDTGVIELSAKIPDRTGRITISVEIDRPAEPSRQAPPEVIPAPSLPIAPSSSKDTPALPRGWALGAGRSLPKLLFLTSKPALARRIGAEWTELILAAIQNAGHAVHHGIPENASYRVAEKSTATALASHTGVKGVVILGGYDVVPARKLDVLDSDLRASLQRPIEDADNFIVWSDGGYGDMDDDGLAECPVSRVPDGQSADFVLKCLGVDSASGQFPKTFGLRNSARPFADEVFTTLAPGGMMHASIPVTLAEFPAWAPPAEGAYFMLHGSWDDTTKFWGEDDVGVVDAFEIALVPGQFTGVVMTGCCWGALIVDKPAARTPSSRPPSSLAPEQSIALKFLASGAQAYVGCTGTHYSPTEEPYDYFGRPMHELFWQYHMQGKGPAEALFLAKRDYLSGIPHHFSAPLARAIEIKIARQFICLGLGW